MRTEYIVICQQAIGNMSVGFSIAYGFDGERFRSAKAAIKHGFVIRESDDFNIATVEGNTLTGFYWMHERMDDDLAGIAEQLGMNFQANAVIK